MKIIKEYNVPNSPDCGAVSDGFFPTSQAAKDYERSQWGAAVRPIIIFSLYIGGKFLFSKPKFYTKNGYLIIICADTGKNDYFFIGK